MKGINCYAANSSPTRLYIQVYLFNFSYYGFNTSFNLGLYAYALTWSAFMVLFCLVKILQQEGLITTVTVYWDHTRGVHCANLQLCKFIRSDFTLLYINANIYGQIIDYQQIVTRDMTDIAIVLWPNSENR